jgi:2-C-methyl-D-erythritol 4-phosphate cytidylyltransferase
VGRSRAGGGAARCRRGRRGGPTGGVRVHKVAIWAVVVAAGSGVRFGARKQYRPLLGRPVVEWAVAAARPHCAGVVLVVPPDELGEEAGGGGAGADVVVAGGTTRSASVRAGLAALPGEADVVAVHDGARPVAVPAVWQAVLAAVAAGADAAVPVVPVTDTLREVGGATVDRARFVAVQTPQAFRAEVLRRGHGSGSDATDDASLVEAAGGRVVVVDGDPANVKITTPVDLALAELLCR